jgi:hypothetical protein
MDEWSYERLAIHVPLAFVGVHVDLATISGYV